VNCCHERDSLLATRRGDPARCGHSPNSEPNYVSADRSELANTKFAGSRIRSLVTGPANQAGRAFPRPPEMRQLSTFSWRSGGAYLCKLTYRSSHQTWPGSRAARKCLAVRSRSHSGLWEKWSADSAYWLVAISWSFEMRGRDEGEQSGRWPHPGLLCRDGLDSRVLSGAHHDQAVQHPSTPQNPRSWVWAPLLSLVPGFGPE
jgi:hypothetical protein